MIPRDYLDRKIFSILRLIFREVFSMSQQLDTLTADTADLKTGVASLIAGYDTVSAQLAALIANPGQPTNEDLSGVIATIAQIKADVVADLTKNAPPAATTTP